MISHFISTPLEWPSLYYVGDSVKISPIESFGSNAYLNPVIVMVNGSTFSAGEIATVILKQLENAILTLFNE